MPGWSQAGRSDGKRLADLAASWPAPLLRITGDIELQPPGVRLFREVCPRLRELRAGDEISALMCDRLETELINILSSLCSQY